jgi:hypothetical protein
MTKDHCTTTSIKIRGVADPKIVTMMFTTPTAAATAAVERGNDPPLVTKIERRSSLRRNRRVTTDNNNGDDDDEEDLKPSTKYDKARRRRRKIFRQGLWHFLFRQGLSLHQLVALLFIVAGCVTVYRWMVLSSRMSPAASVAERFRRHKLAQSKMREREIDAPHHDGKRRSQDESTDGSLRSQLTGQKSILELFQNHRWQPDLVKKQVRTGTDSTIATVDKILQAWGRQLDEDVEGNVHGGPQWTRPYLLPPLPNAGRSEPEADLATDDEVKEKGRRDKAIHKRAYFKVNRNGHMAWQDEWEKMKQAGGTEVGPKIDYTDKGMYVYPDVLPQPPLAGQYPKLQTLSDIMTRWPQDEEYEDDHFEETLIHFDFTNETQMVAALKFRDNQLPFKVYNVPEIQAATSKWTDEYVAEHFGKGTSLLNAWTSTVLADGTAQESPNNYFAFFTPNHWDVAAMGLPPTRNNNWSFGTWAEHAQYADAAPLAADQPHFYWQAGVSREERHQDPAKWTFISKDLPSFSSTEANFFQFHPAQQKGIQCRFGERGVVAATHYDSGRNMVAMITGAKRYILSPPKECSKLGIFTSKSSPIYRHSLLNFGHLKFLNDSSTAENLGMSLEERGWLERAASAQAVETVLKAGEVLFIPSFWFHYIVSVQKSAQCNVRSGIDESGSSEFGGKENVLECN